jgi:hypothetical protein
VRFVPLVDAAPATLALARLRDTDDPLVTEFVDLALEVSSTAALSDATPYAAVRRD